MIQERGSRVPKEELSLEMRGCISSKERGGVGCRYNHVCSG